LSDESAPSTPTEPQVSQDLSTGPHRYVVVSDSHALVGWARRLALNGHDVHTFTTRPAFRHCWSGIMDVRLAPKGDRPSAWADLGAAIIDGHATLLTDSRRVTETFAGAPLVYGAGPSTLEGEPVLAMAIWWDGVAGRDASLVVLEWGPWAGGRGPRVLGAATLLPHPGDLELYPEVAKLAPPGWRGLALVGLAPVGTKPGEFRSTGATLGWPSIVHDLWLWRAEHHSAFNPLEPYAPSPATPLYVGAPISLPPWPHYPTSANRASEAIQLKLGDVAQHVAWHDVRREGGELVGGGADGLVGVAVGHGFTLTRARRAAHMVAGAFQDPRFQWRSDAGATSEEALFTLDVLGLYR
jgi:hypothetical protein